MKNSKVCIIFTWIPFTLESVLFCFLCRNFDKSAHLIDFDYCWVNRLFSSLKCILNIKSCTSFKYGPNWKLTNRWQSKWWVESTIIHNYLKFKLKILNNVQFLALYILDHTCMLCHSHKTTFIYFSARRQKCHVYFFQWRIIWLYWIKSNDVWYAE